MNINDMKQLDPFQTQLIMLLARIAKSLEMLVENDNAR